MFNKKIFSVVVFSLVFLSAQIALANNADISVVSKLVSEFHDQSGKWYAAVLKYSLNLFYLLAILEIGYFGIRMVLGSTDLRDIIKEFCMTILTVSFFLTVMNNYQAWTDWLLSDMQNIIASTGIASSDNPFKIGLGMIYTVMEAVEELPWTEMGLAIAYYISIFIMFICFCMMTANVIVIKCESIVAILASLIMVAFGASGFLREYAINALRYVLSVGFKLFTLQLILGIGLSFANSFKDYSATFDNCLVIIGFALVLLVVSQKVPEIVAGIVSGSHTGNGGGLGMASGMVAGAAIGSMAGVAGAVGGMGKTAANVGRAASIAKEGGAQGFGQVAMGTFKAMRQASHQGKMNKTSMGLELKDRVQKIKEMNKNKEGAE